MNYSQITALKTYECSEAGFCGHGNETSGFTKGGAFLN